MIDRLCQSDYRLYFSQLTPTTKAKKINYMFLRHPPRHLQPPASKIVIAFPVFTLKNRLYITNCQFKSAVICRHFVC